MNNNTKPTNHDYTIVRFKNLALEAQLETQIGILQIYCRTKLELLPKAPHLQRIMEEILWSRKGYIFWTKFEGAYFSFKYLNKY